MDSCVLDREDVQKLQALVPTDEELKLIKEAKAQSPRCPLAPAESCLQTLGGIQHLSSRLHLWAFALDYDALERARGFELSYLGKLSQVRDTHGRQPLLHHLCVLLLEIYPECSDLYSDITAVSRASKCDYSQVQSNLAHLEAHCKASWEQLRLLERDGDRRGKGSGADRSAGSGKEGCLRQNLPQFLKECVERLKVLRAVHRRVINRFHAFLLFLGYSRAMVRETSVEAFCKTVSDFALEYRATRHAILQQREREKEREEGDKEREKRGDLTPQSKPKQQPQTPSQESLEQYKLEKILRAPETSVNKSDLMMRRHRSRTPDKRGLHTRGLKW
ncbi:FH1/FH2 domain-containing protein 3 [Clupea harengus]|uniref:FH1/FH2 domain-containing protein 3 n=1 Tax=Clupea harengus TaxID=7950 RepID=A0A8M1KUJ3_CLUHA|nr:FH1/FH2 domain-containing protein 3 [Clupea harengus]